MRFAHQVAALAGGPPARAWNAGVALTWPLVSRLAPNAHGVVVVRHGALRQRVRFADRSQLVALVEALVTGEYGAATVLAAEPSTIVDAGANIGSAALLFHARWPTARIVAVEPDPHVAALLRRNTRDVERIEVRCAALAATTGWGHLRREAQSWGSRLEADGDVPVETVRLDDLLAERGIAELDLLKLDIEGAEWEVLDSFAGLPSTGAVIGELHPPAPGGEAPAAWVARLGARGGFTESVLLDERRFLLR